MSCWKIQGLCSQVFFKNRSFAKQSQIFGIKDGYWFAGQLNYQAWRFVYLPQMQSQTTLASQNSGDVVANTNDQGDGNEPEEFVP